MRGALEAALDKAESSEETPTPTTTETSEPKDAAPPASPPAATNPPENWPQGLQEAFRSLAPELQPHLLDYNANFEKGMSEAQAELKRYTEAIEPYKALIGQGDPTQAIQSLFRAQQYLQQNPTEGIKWLMRSYGVEKDFEPTAQAPDTTGANEFVDPQIAALKKELEELKGTATRQEEEAARQLREQQMAAVNQFKTEAGEDGNPLRPHFDSVQNFMGALLQTGIAPDLESAYNMALWQNDEWRGSEVKRQIDEAIEAFKAEQAKAAESAEAKTPPVKGGKSTAADTPKKPKGIRAALESTLEKDERGEL